MQFQLASDPNRTGVLNNQPGRRQRMKGKYHPAAANESHKNWTGFHSIYESDYENTAANRRWANQRPSGCASGKSQNRSVPARAARPFQRGALRIGSPGALPDQIHNFQALIRRWCRVRKEKGDRIFSGPR